jgi:LytR cell envelope-related transcriptional attenuator
VLRPAPTAVPTATAPLFPVPDPQHRVTVEVLNGTSRGGLARQATRQLRREGLDVIYFASTDSVTKSRVIDRRGNADAARRVADALSIQTVVTERDPRRRVDVSVWLGADFKPVPDDHP